MKLVEMTVGAFTAVLASDAPAPGGGSTAALSGALGSALVTMVASLTLGKAKYAQHAPLMEEVMAEVTLLREKFLLVMDKDTEAFNAVSAVFTLPKSTDEEKAVRKEAMEKALKGCTETPMEMMELCLETLNFTQKMLGRSNTNAASDLGVAAVSLKAAVQGAWLNVLINLGSIKDQQFVATYKAKGEEILHQCETLADGIYGEVLESL